MDSCVTLDTIGGGALKELFQEELRKVLQNIADLNTDATKKREIAIKVTLKPGKDREAVDVDLHCAAKLSPITTVQTRVFVGKQNGKLVAIESDPRQGNFFDSERPALAAVASFSAKDGE